MPPTPYLPNGQLDIHIVVAGLPHVIQIPVSPIEVGGTWFLGNLVGGFDDAEAADAAQNFWDYVRAVYPTATPAATWVLQERDENIFIPVDGGSLTGTGASGAGAAQGFQATITFKDEEQHLARLQLPETVDNTLQHVPYGGMSASIQAIVDAYLTPANKDEMGNWALTRANLPYDRVLNYTNTSNRKYRRARGSA